MASLNSFLQRSSRESDRERERSREKDGDRDRERRHREDRDPRERGGERGDRDRDHYKGHDRDRFVLLLHLSGLIYAVPCPTEPPVLFSRGVFFLLSHFYAKSRRLLFESDCPGWLRVFDCKPDMMMITNCV